jgi:hypothetical protein
MSALTKWNPFRKSDRLIRAGLAGTLIATGLVFSLVAAETSSRRTATQTFMRMKLAWSQAALEGLTLEKFEVVSQNAIRMRDMTQSNQWFTMKQPDYLARTTNYQKSVDALYMAAVDKNLEAATEAYTKVARNCVECHRLVRTEQRKNAGQPVKTKNDLDLRPVIIP